MYGGTPTGHLHGNISLTDGTITGSNTMYIYPDMKTALVEKFDNCRMKDTQESRFIGLGCDRNGLLYVTQLSTPALPSPHFYYEPPTNISFGAGPPGVLDPYERKWLDLRISDNDNMGEGIYTKRDLRPNTLVASYNGFVFDIKYGESDLYKEGCIMNLTKTDDERRHCKKYSLGLSSRNAHIEIPPEVDQPESFIPSWGPKVEIVFRGYLMISLKPLKSSHFPFMA